MSARHRKTNRFSMSRSRTIHTRLLVEELEPRLAPGVAYPSAYDQYLLELINRGRSDPQAEANRYLADQGSDLNEGLAPGTISTDAKQPLAFNLNLIDAAQLHSQWMLDTDTFDHTGQGGTDPGQRMSNAGYTFTPPWGWGENIAWQGTSGAVDQMQFTADVHEGLFRDLEPVPYPGRGHRLNIMDPDYKEIGVGVRFGDYSGWNAIMATEDFAYSAGNSFLTGVAYDDAVTDDDFYTPGEGLNAITVTATRQSDMAVFNTTTWASGGYTLQLGAGTYNVVATGAGLGGTVIYTGVVIGGQNVKLDYRPDMVVGPAVQVDLQAASDSGVSSTDNITNDTTPTYDITVTDGGTIRIDWDGDATWDVTDVVAGPGVYQYTPAAPLGEGLNPVNVEFDNGSTATDSAPTTIDTTPDAGPNAPDLQAASDSGVSNSDDLTNDTTPTLDVSGFATCYRIYRGGLQVSNDYETAATWTSAVIGEAAHSFTVRSVDAAGNESGDSAALAVTVDMTPDAVANAPDLQAGSDSGVSNTDNITNDATPTLDVSGVASYYRIYGNGVMQVSGNYESGATCTCALPWDGIWNLTVRTVDAAGNESVDSAGVSVTLDRVAGAIPLAPDLQAASDSGVSSTDNITNDTTPTLDIGGFTAYYRVCDGGGLASGSYENGASWTSGALGEGAHSLTVRSVDTAGNESGDSVALSVTVDTTADAAPNAADLQAGSDSGVSSADNITSDTTPTFDVTGFVSYYRVYDGGVPASGSFETGGTWTSGALGDAVHNMTVRSVDVAGNESGDSAGLAVTVDTIPDAVPAAPDLQAGSDSGALATDNITNATTPTFAIGGFAAYYRVYRDGSPVSGQYESGAAWTSGVLADSTCAFTTRSVDAAGNESAGSAALNVTIDTTGPRVTAISPSPGAQASPTADVVATFDEDLDPATVIAANFAVLASGGDGTFADGNETPVIPSSVVWSGAGRTATFSIAGAYAFDTYQVTLNGTSSLLDVAGNRLDGEYTGALPSGDGAVGGDFVSTFTVTPAEITVTDSDAPAGDLAIDFGGVLMDGAGGEVGTATFTIRNDGGDDLVVNSVSIVGGGEYSISGLPVTPFTVTSGNSVVGTVTFDPTANGIQTDTLRVQSNDGDEATVDIALSAFGMTPLVMSTGAFKTMVMFDDADGDKIMVLFSGAGEAWVATTNGLSPEVDPNQDIAYVGFRNTTNYSSFMMFDIGGAANTMTAGKIETRGAGSMGMIQMINSWGAFQNTEIDIGGALSSCYFICNTSNVDLDVGGKANMVMVTGTVANSQFDIDGGAYMFMLSRGATNTQVALGADTTVLYCLAAADNLTLNVTGKVGTGIFCGAVSNSNFTIRDGATMLMLSQLLSNSSITTTTAGIGTFYAMGGMANASSVSIAGNVTTLYAMGGIRDTSSVHVTGEVVMGLLFGPTGGAAVEAGASVRIGTLKSMLMAIGQVDGDIEITGTANKSLTMLIGNLAVGGQLRVTGAAGVFGNVMIIGRLDGAITATNPGAGNTLSVSRGGGGSVNPANAFATITGFTP